LFLSHVYEKEKIQNEVHKIKGVGPL